MLTGFADAYRRTDRTPVQGSGSSGVLSRLVAAAVVNQEFRELLLSDPERALSQGYGGERFPLDYAEKRLVISIRAKNLTDFALQLLSHQEEAGQVGSGDWTPVNQPAMVMDAE